MSSIADVRTDDPETAKMLIAAYFAERTANQLLVLGHGDEATKVFLDTFDKIHGDLSETIKKAKKGSAGKAEFV